MTDDYCAEEGAGIVAIQDTPKDAPLTAKEALQCIEVIQRCCDMVLDAMTEVMREEIRGKNE